MRKSYFSHQITNQNEEEGKGHHIPEHDLKEEKNKVKEEIDFFHFVLLKLLSHPFFRFEKGATRYFLFQKLLSHPFQSVTPFLKEKGAVHVL